MKETQFPTGTKTLDIKDFSRFSFNQSSPLLPVFSVFNHSCGLDFVKCFFLYLFVVSYNLFHVYECFPACTCVCHVLAVHAESRRGHWIPCSGVIGHGEPPYRCWELSQGLWPEKQVLLTTELSFQTPQEGFYCLD